MGEENGEKKPFRYLTDAEFRALPVKDRAVYLVQAQQELEIRQQALRAQRESLAKVIARNGS
jgi:hypothetical protein